MKIRVAYPCGIRILQTIHDINKSCRPPPQASVKHSQFSLLTTNSTACNIVNYIIIMANILRVAENKHKCSEQQTFDFDAQIKN